MLKADNTQKRCFVACDEQTKKDGRCSCLSNTHQSLQLLQPDVSGSLPKSEVIEVFQKLKDAINDKGCCGNAHLIGSIVWNAFEKFGGNDR